MTANFLLFFFNWECFAIQVKYKVYLYQGKHFKLYSVILFPDEGSRVKKQDLSPEQFKEADYRPSAISIGTMELAILLIALIAIAIMDLHICYKNVKYARKNISHVMKRMKKSN